MKSTEITKPQQAVADFRFGIIADLVYSHAQGPELAKQIAAKAAKDWEVPNSRKRTITASCIRKWLKAYRLHGRAGLVPRERKDKGSCKVLSDTDKELILGLLEQKPGLCASVAVRTLQREGKLDKEVSKSSLSRFIVSSGFTRAERTRVGITDQILRFSFEFPLECVQVDAMHSFKVPDHKGKMRKAILIAFLDDATRRVVYSRFSFSEDSLEFERGLFHVLQAHGRVRRVYTDNGATFIADQTKRILDSLGILLIHSRPGRPRGRGKVERFFRTVRTQFEAPLDPADLRSIQDYDQRFRIWLESEYHRTVHSSLNKQTPLDAWLAGSRHIIPMDPTIDLVDAFCHRTERRVESDATVSWAGVHYEVPSVLIGRKVDLRMNPLVDVPVVRVRYDNKDYGTARRIDEYANARSRRIMAPDASAQAALRSSGAIGGRK